MHNAITTAHSGAGYASRMQGEPVKIYASKQPRRPHHILDWMQKRGMRAVDLAKQLGADKSVVSRWLKGTTPTPEWQEKLAALFHCEPEALFRHPDDDWLTRMFRDRTAEEVERMKNLLEAAFPRNRKAS